MAGASTSHIWRFFQAGGFDQVRLDTAEDFDNLDKLDQKLWVALGCPIKGLECDERTLALIDTDGDGRIRAPEIIAAAKWACEVLKKPADLTKRREALPLADINDVTAPGRVLLNSARQILDDLGKKDATDITVADTVDTAKIFAQTKFNGDGIVPSASADDDDTKKVIEEIIATAGSETDRSGAAGISQAKVDAFFDACKAFDAWWKAAEDDAARVLPLGEATAAAADALDAVAAKLDDFFARTKLAAFDARALESLNGDQSAYVALGNQLVSAGANEVEGMPLARIEAGRKLPLDGSINPAWSARIATFVSATVTPLLGARTTLSEGDLAAIRDKLAPYAAWKTAKSGGIVEALGLPRVRSLLGSDARDRVVALIAKDEALRPEADAIASVERLVRYYRDLHAVLDNFVSFRDFYSKKRKAIFQAGTLYLDGRSCELCIRVADAAGHAAFATTSRTFLAYCDCVRKGGAEKMTIAAAFTGGDADQLAIGRNGIFYDRAGNDWDATIVKLVEHPISIRQAFWLPYRRVGKLIGDQIEKFASARDKEMHEKAAAHVETGAKNAEKAAANASAPTPPVAPAPAAAPAPAPPATAFDVARFAGVFAAIGLAIGAIGSAFAAIATGFLGLRWWQMPLVVAGVVLLISGPSMIIAALKLRQRNLGPILDANGWAVNARARMNIPFGGSLTHVAELPSNAERSLDDPYADKKSPWPLWITVVVIAVAIVYAWQHGWIKKWLDASHGAATAPAASASAK